MTRGLSSTFRLLGPPDHQAVIRIAAYSGAHGVYVRNSVARNEPGIDRILGIERTDCGLAGLGWFGNRGNLIVLGDSSLEGATVAAAIRGQRADWRICLGPAAVVDALAGGEPLHPLVLRDQIYYGIESGGVRFGRLRDDVRRATRQDVRALVEAALDLNESDLNVARYRVHRGWLRDTVKRRIRDGITWVIGRPGEPRCKLDIGSSGPAGHVIEGVHTIAAARCEGLATGLVATVADHLLAQSPLVCLHVAAENRAARVAYEHAGMREVGACRILLRG